MDLEVVCIRVIFTRIRSLRVGFGHVCHQKDVTSNRSSSYYKVSLLGSRLPMKLMLEAKRVVRIVKASSFVGATILSAKMGTVIYIYIRYHVTAHS